MRSENLLSTENDEAILFIDIASVKIDNASCKQDILQFTCDSVSVRVTQCKSVNVPFSIRKNYDKIVGISYIDPIRPIE